MKARRITRDDQGKPTKEEYAVAKCLKFNAPYKGGKFEGNNVHYFMGSKIVDFLLESQWSSKKSKTNPLFTTRSSCTSYCSRLLSKGFFCRVEKQEKKKKEVDKVPAKEEIGGIIKRGKAKREKCKKAEDEAEASKAGDQSGEDGRPADQAKDDSSNEDKKKKKKTPRLNFHSDQKFIDGQDLYVWLYDPVPVKTFVIGLLLVVGAIAVCLFPLWPPEIKLGIYYLSCAAFGFIGLILSLCVVRLIVFVLVWLFSMGDVSLWLLPSLTEDVGFVDSFKPLYKISYGSEVKETSQKTAKSEKDSDVQSEVKSGNEDEEEEQKNDDDDYDEENENEGKEPDDETKDKVDGEDDDEEEEEEEQEVEEEEDGNESYEVIDADDDEDDAAVKIDDDDLLGDGDKKADKKND